VGVDREGKPPPWTLAKEPAPWLTLWVTHLARAGEGLSIAEIQF
jgi:hypothetical protein